MASFKIPKAVELSVHNGVTGCLCPNSMRIILIGAPLWAFWKHAPTSDSADNATTFFMKAATLRIDPLRFSSFGGFYPQNKIPPRRLRSCGTGKYYASL
jgi:hypothetical protein